jgi:DNA 3'-phosphatase
VFASSNAQLCALYLSGRRQILDSSFVITDSKVKVAFFDADSTLRKSKSGKFIVGEPSDVEILSGVVEKIKELNAQGYLIAVVSNQGGVPKQVSYENADQTLLATLQMIRDQGAVIHYYDFAEGKNENRKPGTGMAKNLQRVLDMDFPEGVKIDYAQSFMVGDAAYKKGELRPDGTKGNDFSNSDRLFAEAIKVPFEEARYFFGWKKKKVAKVTNEEVVKEEPNPVVKEEPAPTALEKKSKGRTAQAIPLRDLKAKVYLAWSKLEFADDQEKRESDKEWVETKEFDQDFDEFVGDMLNMRFLNSQIKKDLSKVEFDEEALTDATTEIRELKKVVGFHTLDNGLSFLGVTTRSESEEPLFFIVYWDGKKLRAYLPTDGNVWNTATKAAYNAGETKLEFDAEKLLKDIGERIAVED